MAAGSGPGWESGLVGTCVMHYFTGVLATAELSTWLPKAYLVLGVDFLSPEQ